MSYSPSRAGVSGRCVELRTGTPYANLIRNQTLYAAAVGEHLSVRPENVVPMAGATGGIEAVRNHVFRTSRRAAPIVQTVCPGYWRARESFEGLGFETRAVPTGPSGFSIDETAFAEMARKDEVDLIYLSLPNNPTGAVFDPELIISNVPDAITILLDVTLPSRSLDSRALTEALYHSFRGRRNLFLVGSTSKSHETAEHRAGWIVCAGSDDADALRRENRNAIASFAIEESMKRLCAPPTVLGRIDDSFALLREGEKRGRFQVVRPARVVETGYVLIDCNVRLEGLRACLNEGNITVMWGSEFGLDDRYIRLETLEPANIKVFIDAIEG